MFFKLLILMSIIFLNIQADNIKKGQKIYDIMCDKKAISNILYDNKDELLYQIEDKHYCSNIDKKKLNLVVDYLINKNKIEKKDKISVPKGSKCPVCGMLTAKYPKWVATITENDGKTYYFDGVKDMMKYYLNPKHFHHDIKKIKHILVSDYYTLNATDAKKAWFVIGSNIYGPMGAELIPFKNQTDAKEFAKEHFGKKIVKFEDITEDLVYGLD